MGWLTTAEFAKRLGKSPERVRQLIHEGTLPASHVRNVGRGSRPRYELHVDALAAPPFTGARSCDVEERRHEIEDLRSEIASLKQEVARLRGSLIRANSALIAQTESLQQWVIADHASDAG